MEKGQQLVEYLITFPIFFLILLGIFDLGRVVYYNNAMQNAAREGARFAIVNPDAQIDPDIENQIFNRVKERTLGVNADDVTPSISWTCGRVKVTVQVAFKPVTPIIGAFFPLDGEGKITIQTNSELQRERWLPKECSDPES